MAEFGQGLRYQQARDPSRQAQRLMDRWGTSKQHFAYFEHDYQDITDLIVPSAPDTLTKRTPGESRTVELYDSTAMVDNIKLAANLMGNVTNEALDWYRNTMDDEMLADDQEVAQWLSVVAKHQQRVFSASNFYQAMHTFYLNYGAFGTAALYNADAQMVRPGLIPGQVFIPLPHGSYWILEDADLQVNTMFRLAMWSPVQAMQLFGEQVSQQVREQAKDERLMDTPAPYLHVVYPREEWQPGSISNKKMPYASVYLEVETQHITDESGYHEWPFMVARWEKLTDSPWGFGPGHMALPDIRTLNRMKALQIQMLQLWVQPPLKQVYEGVLGSISFESLAINVVRRPDDLTTMDLSGRPDLVQIEQADLRRSIHDIFFITGMEAVPPPEAPGTMTAYEVAQRVAINARLMGPAFSRLTSEGLTRLIDRSFGLEWRKGRIPPPPPQILEAAARRGGQIDIEYLGPLARSQKATDLQAIIQTYAVGAQMAEAKASRDPVFDMLDDDVAIRRAAEAANVPPEMIRDTVAVGAMRRARAEAQQQMAQGMQAGQTATTLKDIAPFLAALNAQNGQRAA